MKIEIDINGVHRDEIEELKKYLEEKLLEVASFKHQASSFRIPKGSGFFKTKKDLTAGEGYSRMNLERNNYGQ